MRTLPAHAEELRKRARVHVTRHADCDVQWLEWGQGSPLIALHGGHGSWMHWLRNIEALAAQHRVIVPDMPGFGSSGDFALPPRDPARIDLMVDALKAGVEDILGPDERFHLMGFSFGGLVSSLLAQKSPQLRSLVLLGTAGHGLERPRDVVMRDWRKTEGAERDEVLRENLAAFMLHGPIDDDGFGVHAWSCEHTRFHSKAFSRDARTPSALADVQAPMFMLWGEEDVTGEPVKVAEHLVQGHKDREWMVLPNAGHWVQWDSASAVNKLLTFWLSQH